MLVRNIMWQSRVENETFFQNTLQLIQTVLFAVNNAPDLLPRLMQILGAFFPIDFFVFVGSDGIVLGNLMGKVLGN